MIKRKNNMKEELRTLDLFAGVGGVRLGFEKAGFKTVFANDFDKTCKDTYDLNFSDPKLTIKDIWKVDIKNIPEFDILLGGFPCQAFSIAGYRKGFEDKRVGGNLFFRIAEILEERKPTAFLLENVKNLKGHDKGKTFKIIRETLEGLGYHIKSEVLNSMKHGNIPQNRERIFIVGFLDKEKTEAFEFPKQIPLKTNFKQFTLNEADDKYYYNDKPLYEKIKNDINSEFSTLSIFRIKPLNLGILSVDVAVLYPSMNTIIWSFSNVSVVIISKFNTLTPNSREKLYE